MSLQETVQEFESRLEALHSMKDDLLQAVLSAHPSESAENED